MRLSFLFLISCVIINYSCTENSTGVILGGDNIMPLKLGNYWKMEHTLYDSFGNVFYIDTTSQQVVRDTLLNNVHLFSFGSYKYYYTNNADGLWDYIFNSSGNEEHYLYLKYPCKAGDIYNYSITRPDAVVTVVSTNETVPIKAGSFSCILYRFDFPEIVAHTNIYATPRIGIIKYEHFSRGDIATSYKDIEEQLLEYQLK